MVSHLRACLDNHGYAVLKNFCPPDELDDLRQAVATLHQQEGDAAGSEFKQEEGSIRLANLANKGDVFLKLIATKQILEFVRQVLGPQLAEYQLRPAITPPSTFQTAPVTQLAASLSKNATVDATSAGRPMRPIG